eukprot:7262441-Ditylum_brightwellii.AAC.1
MENDAAPDPAIEDQFNWDEDATMQPTTHEEGKVAEEDKGGSGKRTSSKPPNTAAKISKKHGGVRLTTQDDTTSKTIKDKIKIRGEEAIDAEGGLKTRVKVEWQM